MSVWTHAAGIIRLDFIESQAGSEQDAIRDALGKEFNYKDMYDRALCDDLDEHPEDYMPFGSEGSLRATILKNPNCSEHVTSLPIWTIVIEGDLRDYDAPAAIVEWFKEVCRKLKYVRDATIVAREDVSNKTVSWCARDSWRVDGKD